MRDKTNIVSTMKCKQRYVLNDAKPDIQTSIHFKGKQYCESMNGLKATLLLAFPYPWPNMSLSFEFQSPINAQIHLHLDVPASCYTKFA